MPVGKELTVIDSGVGEGDPDDVLGALPTTAAQPDIPRITAANNENTGSDEYRRVFREPSEVRRNMIIFLLNPTQGQTSQS